MADILRQISCSNVSWTGPGPEAVYIDEGADSESQETTQTGRNLEHEAAAWMKRCCSVEVEFITKERGRLEFCRHSIQHDGRVKVSWADVQYGDCGRRPRPSKWHGDM